jgi:hypothetical protein
LRVNWLRTRNISDRRSGEENRGRKTGQTPETLHGNGIPTTPQANQIPRFQGSQPLDMPPFENGITIYLGTRRGLSPGDINIKSDAQSLGLDDQDVFCAGGELV